MRVVLALVVTFVALVFSREVTRSAHQESAARLSENLSFASLATTLIAQENSFDTALATLLNSGAHLTRAEVATKLSQFTQELSAWRSVAQIIRTPVLTPNLNVTLSDETLTRVDDYDVVVSEVAHALTLSGPTIAATAPTLGQAQASLAATAATWGSERHLLATAPGAVTLPALSALAAGANVPQDLAVLSSANNLLPTRAMEIAAIQVQPAPLPSPALTLSFTPTTSIQVQVAVTNRRELLQPLSVTVTFTPSVGTPQTFSATQTLSPLTSYAFAPATFAVFPGEHGTLSVLLTSSPVDPTLTHRRVYSVVVAPASVG